MISDKELKQVIAECENGKPSLANCEKLATFYTIYDHRNAQTEQREEQEPIEGDSEVVELLNSIERRKAWEMVLELIEAVQVLNPKLYKTFIKKLAE